MSAPFYPSDSPDFESPPNIDPLDLLLSANAGDVDYQIDDGPIPFCPYFEEGDVSIDDDEEEEDAGRNNHDGAALTACRNTLEALKGDL